MNDRVLISDAEIKAGTARTFKAWQNAGYPVMKGARAGITSDGVLVFTQNQVMSRLVRRSVYLNLSDAIDPSDYGDS